jgi:stage II sporulation protein AA (anti-sigma F factor antagonist)
MPRLASANRIRLGSPRRGYISARMADERPFSVRCEQRDGGVIVAAAGEVDLSTTPALREQLRSPAAQAPVVVLDLREVTFMDSSGLGAIVGQHKRAREHGFRFAVAVGGAAGVERILVLSQLVGVLEVVQAPDDVLPA